MVRVTYGNEPDSMVRKLISDAGSLDSFRSNDHVMIKPNLVVSRSNWSGVNTDPRVVEALVALLKERGLSRITVGDGSGMGYNAGRAMEVCGYRTLAKRYGLTLVDLEKDTFVERDAKIEGPFETLQIAKTILECDFLINIPVMKAHTETLITCALKNMKGVMPRAMKTAFHGVDLHRAIAQLASVVSPDLILVDGLQGDLFSETGHDPVVMDMMILGTNPVETDSVVADILGYRPGSIRHIHHSAAGGLGNCNLEEIRVKPLGSPSVKKRPSPPRHYSTKFPCEIRASGACCTCMGNLLFALERLRERGLLHKDQCFLIGQKADFGFQKRQTSIAVGRCAAGRGESDISIQECPPTANTIFRRISGQTG